MSQQAETRPTYTTGPLRVSRIDGRTTIQRGDRVLCYFAPYPEAEADAELFAASLVKHRALVAAADLLLRCDAEIMPNDLPPASDEDWDAVVEQVRDAIREGVQSV